MTNVFSRTIELIIVSRGTLRNPDHYQSEGMQQSDASSPCIYVQDVNSASGFRVSISMLDCLFMLMTRLYRYRINPTLNMSTIFSLLKLDKVSVWGPASCGMENRKHWVYSSFNINRPIELTVYNYQGTDKTTSDCLNCPRYFLFGMCSAIRDGSFNRRASVSISNPGAQYSLLPIEFADPEFFEDPTWIEIAIPSFSIPKDYDVEPGIILAVAHITLTGEMCRDSMQFNHY